ncbi:hypothetical protein EYF80_050721 [Liparis tanakae]|uniref:Uncharacterized protein n=1 Tax=Liparis tanakae TaxID=230148 RepID=A0A4Z2FDY1_9TELE|nr:hypothetical protein EYF80_050721 [Liparis tanakae]
MDHAASRRARRGVYVRWYNSSQAPPLPSGLSLTLSQHGSLNNFSHAYATKLHSSSGSRRGDVYPGGREVGGAAPRVRSAVRSALMNQSSSSPVDDSGRLATTPTATPRRSGFSLQRLALRQAPPEPSAPRAKRPDTAACVQSSTPSPFSLDRRRPLSSLLLVRSETETKRSN